ncbi:MAG: hypothetical protein ACUVQZ_00545, partial [Candidatus Caldatribacteriaceae bacterium]
LDQFIKSEEKEKGERIFRALLGEEVLPLEEQVMNIVNAWGEERVVRWSYRTLYDGARKIEGWVISGIDITKEILQWEEIKSDQVFHQALLSLTHQAFQGEWTSLEGFFQNILISLLGFSLPRKPCVLSERRGMGF